MKRRRKSAVKSAGTALVPQPHGGALLPAGVHGNRGGTGRPRDEIRALLRHSLEEALPVLTEIIADPAASNSDKLRAIDIAARYGLGTAEDAKPLTIGEMHLAALKELNARNRATATAKIVPDAP